MVTAAPAFASSLVAVTGTLDAPVTDGRVTFSHGTFENTTNKPMTITMTWTMGGPTHYKNAFTAATTPTGWTVTVTATLVTFTITLAAGATSPAGTFSVTAKNAGNQTVTCAFKDSVSGDWTTLFADHPL